MPNWRTAAPRKVIMRDQSRSARGFGGFSILLFGFLLSPACCASENGPLVMGIFPRRNFQETVQCFTPMARYLAERLGRDVRLDVATDFESFWEGVKTQRYDIVHYNQYHYVKSHKQFGYVVIAKNEEFGVSTIAGAISVRKNSGIRSPRDLKGKIIVFGGDRTAMQSYIVASYLLRKAGLGKSDYVEKFAKNPPNAHLAVYFGQADAAGVGDHVGELPIVNKRIDTSEMTFVAIGEPLAHLPWAVKASVETEMRDRIQDALLDLNDTLKGRQILKQARLTGLVVAVDGDYDPHRRIIREVLGEKY